MLSSMADDSSRPRARAPIESKKTESAASKATIVAGSRELIAFFELQDDLYGINWHSALPGRFAMSVRAPNTRLLPGFERLSCIGPPVEKRRPVFLASHGPLGS